jgi:hypothetical protein
MLYIYIYISGQHSKASPQENAHIHTYAMHMLTYADVCYIHIFQVSIQKLVHARMIIYIRMLCICWRILTYAIYIHIFQVSIQRLVQARMLEMAQRQEEVCWRMLTYADVCWRILTYADVCWRMPRMLKMAQRQEEVCWRMLTYIYVCIYVCMYMLYVCIYILSNI